MSVEEPAVVNIPVLTIQDPLAAAGAVVLDCRPPLLPVSMDIRGVDLAVGGSAGMDVLLPGREPLSIGGGGDLLGLICPELGVAPLVARCGYVWFYVAKSGCMWLKVVLILLNVL